MLIVETAEMSVNMSIVVIEAVSSISDFVGFLPLGNRVIMQLGQNHDQSYQHIGAVGLRLTFIERAGSF